MSARDHELFLESPTYSMLVGFVFGLAEAVCGRPNSSVGDDSGLSEPVHALLEILKDMEELVRQTPPEDPLESKGSAGSSGPNPPPVASRFGNKRFRDFVAKVRRRIPAWHREKLGLSSAAAIAEAGTYLLASLGSRARLDYGSGHELHFIVYLFALRQMSILSLPRDGPALVLRVFASYLRVVRAAQAAYYLEPAGSHGVWGLDDYQFLPFLFGASQLLGHKYITPRSAVHSQATLDEEADQWMYLDQVRHVNASKTVQDVRWHSPMLDDISAARSWEKVEGGMRRLFVADVLRKLPVMQHFLFGSLVPAAPGMSQDAQPPPKTKMPEGENEKEEKEEDPVLKLIPEDDDDRDDGDRVTVFDDARGARHVHTQDGWGECCGIKVPSGIAAVEEQRKRGGVQTLRRIPFD